MDKIQDYSLKAKQFILDFYAKKGKKGVVQGLALTLGIYYFLYIIRRNNGWLRKKSVVGKHVFITGGGSGLGKQMAIRFLNLRAKVTIVDVNQIAIDKVVEEQKLLGHNDIQAIQCDVSSYQSVQQAAQQAVQRFGIVDILINNAGIVSGKNIRDNTPQNIERTLAVNTTAHHWTVKAFLPQMIQQNSGQIVTIASIAGMLGVNGLADYCASKFGAVGFDESLRFELRSLKSKVRTTCICPYFINTGMFDGASSKFPLLLPILSEKYATTRIMNGILQEESVVIMPFMCSITVVLKALLPVSACDWICEAFGASDSMKDFKGRPQQL